jgi:hypothetical protein
MTNQDQPKTATVVSRFKAVVAAVVAAFLALGGIGIFGLLADRASLSISNVEFEPSIPLADSRMRLAITIKNSGRHSATIEEVATDRADHLPTEPQYEFAQITPVAIPPGGKLRLITDLGTKPLVLTQLELNSIKDERASFTIDGFIKYSDIFNWILGNAVLGFCYVWDPKDTRVGNFSVCQERQYTYSYHYWFRDGIRHHEIPMVTIGIQTVSPTTAPLKVPDPRFPIKQVDTEAE